MSLQQWCVYSWLALAVIVRAWLSTKSIGITLLVYIGLSFLPVMAMILVDMADHLVKKALSGIRL